MRRGTAIAIIFIIFVLPFALVWGGVVPVEYRRWLYAIVGLAAFAIARRQWTWRELGFRWDNARAAVLPYAAFAIVGAIAIIAVSLAIGRSPRTTWWLAPHFRYGLLLPISAAQELFYRSILIPILQRIVPVRWFVILADAALFAFLHIIFPDPWIVMPVTFIGGILFTAIWLRYPNFWLASVAHVALNAVFVLFCFGSIERSCLV